MTSTRRLDMNKHDHNLHEVPAFPKLREYELPLERDQKKVPLVIITGQKIHIDNIPGHKPVTNQK